MRTLHRNESELTDRRRLPGRRYHVAVAVASGRVLMHGGEGYNHLLPKSGEMRGDLAVWEPSTKHDGVGGRWFDVSLRSATVSRSSSLKPSSLEKASPKLSAHCALPTDRGVLVFAGFKDAWRPSKDTFLLRSIDDY